MYILYETPDVSHHHNWIEEIGQYLNYRVGYFDDELLYSHRLPKMIPLPNKDVAMAWKFAGNLTGTYCTTKNPNQCVSLHSHFTKQCFGLGVIQGPHLPCLTFRQPKIS